MTTNPGTRRGGMSAESESHGLQGWDEGHQAEEREMGSEAGGPRPQLPGKRTSTSYKPLCHQKLQHIGTRAPSL